MGAVGLQQASEPERLWAAARQVLEFEVTNQQFLSYVTLVRARTTQNGSRDLCLVAPSEAIANWLRDNLLQRIVELVGRPHALDIRIEVALEPDLFSPRPTTKQPRAAAPRKPAAAAANLQASSGLAPDLLFDNFVSGPSNEMALAAALKLASEPEAVRVASPLYIHGAVGLGKTHLAHALGNKFATDRPGTRLRVLSGEQFMREVQATFTNNKIQDFRDRFRRLDLLILDDIQLIGRDSEQTHKQFLALFNFMDERQLPIVITSDRPALQLNRNLPSRLLSRVAMGLDVVIATPDLDTRIGILCSQAKSMLGRDLPEATARLLALRLRSNCRELIGALRRLAHYADFHGTGLTPEVAGIVLKESPAATPNLTPREIIERTSQHYGIRPTDMRGKRRTQSLVRARHVAMFLCRELTEVSLPEIGTYFACHHSSVLHACRKIAKNLHESPELGYEINSLRQGLAG